MAVYRYFTADLLTGNVLAELPLLSPTFGRRLSAAGDFRATFLLGTGQYDDSELLAGTQPMRTALYVKRDDVLIWGGILWTRSYESDSHVMNINASTFESYFDRMVIQSDFVRQNVDQLQIFKDLIDQLQLQDASNIGLITSGLPTVSGVNTTQLIPGYEYHFANEVVSNLLSSDNAFDYTIDVTEGATTDHPVKTVQAGYPKIGVDSGIPVEYDYPGSITKYTWPEAGGGTKFAVLGNGAGSSMLRAEAVADALIALGYPSWWVVKSYKSLSTQSQVTAKAAAVRDQNTLPLTVPTFELRSDRVPEFDEWSVLGANMNVYIEDYRFPNGKQVTSRMIGWSLQPGGGDKPEVLTLAIEGDDGSA